MSCLAKAITIGLLTGMVGLMLGIAPVGLDLEEHVGLHILFRLRGERQAPAVVMIVSIDKASATHLDLPNDPAE
jgi:adenylate cyclase